MCDSLGRSVFVSRFDEVKAALASEYRPGSFVFTSLHIAEEFDDDYARKAEAMCAELADTGYSIIADVSPRGLAMFGETDLERLARRLRVHALRLDYGFSDSQIAEAAKKIPLCCNASTLSRACVEKISRDALRLYAMHNYYPRPDTGLDEDFFARVNADLAELKVEVFAFIPGDGLLRGPLFRGLPTLEKHRDQAPYAAFVDMARAHRLASIFIGDPALDPFQSARIHDYIDKGCIDMPVVFDAAYRWLENKSFTIRPDSPRKILRLAESRDYATQGSTVAPRAAVERPRGSVTIDNALYLRYSGETQILARSLPADEKVNVIGFVPAEYHLLLDACRPGDSIRFVGAGSAA